MSLPYVPRLFVHDDGRVIISVRIGEGRIHGVGFLWMLIDGTDRRWVEPMAFPDFVEVAVTHPALLKTAHGRNW